MERRRTCIWYGAVRCVAESLKTDNWLHFGVPTAQFIATITLLGVSVILVARHAPSPRSAPPEELADPPVTSTS